MTTIAGVLGFAALFAVFGLLAPVIRRKGCGGGGCGACGGSCKYTD